MTQTVKGSIAEAWANIAVGFGINYAANLIILPMFGFHTLTLMANLEIGMLYTGISLVRSFVLRRWFNGLKFGNKEVVAVVAPPPAPIAPPERERTLPDFLDKIISALQEKGVSHVDATVYSPRFNELADLRIQLLGRKPRLH